MFLFSFSEFLESDLVKALDFTVNLITAIGLLAGIPWALSNKSNNLLAAKISNYLHYCVRLSCLVLIGVALFVIGYLIYGVLFYWVFLGDSTDKSLLNLSFWLLSIFISGSICLALGWILGSFVLTSSWHHASNFLSNFLPHQDKYRKQLESFEIIFASYGVEGNEVDVTKILQKLIKNNRLDIVVNNKYLSDPCLGQIKRLIIRYKFGNGEFVKEFKENEPLKLPHGD